MNPNLQPVFDAISKLAADLLVVGLVALAGYLTPLVKRFIEAKVAEVRSRLTPSEQAVLDYIAPIAVDAVEGLKMSGVIEKGKAAQDAACAYITDYLASRGVKLPVSTIVARVEAEVLRAYNAPKVEAAKG